MQIIYIENEFLCRRDVEAAFTAMGCELIFCPAPPLGREEQGAYLQVLLSEVKSIEPAFIFSLGYHPFLSLACGVLQSPYVCWLVEPYHRDYYDATIGNEWNYVFVADSILYEELKAAGVANAYFLPLAAPTVEAASESSYVADVSCIGSVLRREQLKVNPLSVDSDLKDATRGYLEGCIACQCQTRKLPPMCSKLPTYVWKDLISVYPPQVENRVEKATQYYDHVYFDDMVTYASRRYYLSALAELDRYQKIHHYSASEEIVSKKIKNCGRVDYYEVIPSIVRGSKLNLVLSHYSLRAGIPVIAWMVLGAGGFLLGNYQKDYKILSPVEPVLFQDIHEMRRKADYYDKHEKERKDITVAILTEIEKKHMYVHRIAEMFSVLSE